MLESKTKFVDFHTYCQKCKYKDKPESEDPCNKCLTNPVNEDSHKPLYFKEGRHDRNQTAHQRNS